jgi:myosin heavy subunit
VLAKDKNQADMLAAKCKRADAIVAAQVLLDGLTLASGQFQVGKTKVFFRREALELLEAARARVVDGCLVKLQAAVRKMVYSKRFARMKAASLEMQRAARGRLARKRFQEMLMSIMVQARWRGYARKRAYLRVRGAVVQIQGAQRRKIARNEAAKVRTDRKAAVLQALIRRRPEFFMYQRQKVAAVVMQKHSRVFAQKAKYVQMRDTARQKANLENRWPFAPLAPQSLSIRLRGLNQLRPAGWRRSRRRRRRRWANWRSSGRRCAWRRRLPPQRRRHGRLLRPRCTHSRRSWRI